MCRPKPTALNAATRPKTTRAATAIQVMPHGDGSKRFRKHLSRHGFGRAGVTAKRARADDSSAAMVSFIPAMAWRAWRNSKHRTKHASPSPRGEGPQAGCQELAALWCVAPGRFKHKVIDV